LWAARERFFRPVGGRAEQPQDARRERRIGGGQIAHVRQVDDGEARSLQAGLDRRREPGDFLLHDARKRREGGRRRRPERLPVQLLRPREVRGRRHVVLGALGDEPQVVLGPGVRLLGGELLQLRLRLVEPAQLEQRHPLLAARLAVLAVQLDRLVGRGQRLAGAAEVVERHRLEQVEVLEQRAVLHPVRARERAARVRESQLQIVAAAQAADVQIGRGPQHLGIVGVQGQRPRVRGAGLVDVPELGERGAAEVVGGDALRIDAPGLARALQRILEAALLEIAGGLLEQVGHRRLAPLRQRQARRRRRLGLGALGPAHGVRGVDRLGGRRCRGGDDRGVGGLGGRRRLGGVVRPFASRRSRRRGGKGERQEAAERVSHRWPDQQRVPAPGFPPGIRRTERTR
jgi:hypothetical protein